LGNDKPDNNEAIYLSPQQLTCIVPDQLLPGNTLYLKIVLSEITFKKSYGESDWGYV